ncbi:uncharacterized protein N7483_011152 [Penicillium malachiteum]|uniref:uncharacterized protein n=1 Tax=Penicillium malachiteum TaxID=1324776 RepID=UPI002547D9A4|nr:uncharacterized protein N7483_011152 [Penicillium malachiteum]KAJ5713971.1 hypothetical protein N7483_011152 [Penicillium malachiteum]
MESQPEKAQNDQVARIIWAAHILSFLTTANQGHKSDAELQKANATEEEFEDFELETSTKNATLLTTGNESVQKKFLDCIAQLFSPQKGWHGVTPAALREYEDSVEIDIARNDTWKKGTQWDQEALNLCKRLEGYLSATSEKDEPFKQLKNDCEEDAITYSRERVDHWIETLRSTLKNNMHDLRYQHSVEVCLRSDTGTKWLIFFGSATKMVSIKQVKVFNSDNFTPSMSFKLSNCLRFIARPITDCQLLLSIAEREQQFQQIQISLITPEEMSKLDSTYCVGLEDAFSQLGLDKPSTFRKCDIAKSFGRKFEKVCKKASWGPFSLHAEMQLISHYDVNKASPPTFHYFGCSKKTCLLCETFLSSLPVPINTRGRHGICYPTWGLPSLKSAKALIAAKSMEESLVSRIKSILQVLERGDKPRFLNQIAQSGIVSDFSETTLDGWKQREQILTTLKAQSEARRRDFSLTHQSTHPRESMDIRAPTSIRGVKICCQGEPGLHGTDWLISVDFDRSSLRPGEISPISERLGMPIRLWKGPDHEFFANPPGWENNCYADSNANAAALMMEMDLRSSNWGWAPFYWTSEIDNVYAVREDGFDLDIGVVEMMCYFARSEIMEIMLENAVCSPDLQDKQKVLDYITWENMFRDWKMFDKKAMDGYWKNDECSN